MADVLLLVGRGNQQAVIEKAAQLVEASLVATDFSVVRFEQDGAASSLPGKVGELVAEHRPRLVCAVGFTACVYLSEAGQLDVPLVSVLPDLPRGAEGIYEKVQMQVAGLLGSGDFLVVLDEASRVELEYRVAGAAGRVLLPSQLSVLRGFIRPVHEFESVTKILISGHDFRFISDLVMFLRLFPGVQVRLQDWALAATEPSEEQQEEIAWADVILAEWAGRNAVWFSHNLAEYQRLFVHLHGFEAQADWIAGLNLSRIEKLVVVSDFYRQQLIADKGWDADKLLVIPNAVQTALYAREKQKDARFHCALLGFIPFLKRPDIAVEILRLLVAKDERFVLHLRGKQPWRHDWLWNRQLEQSDAYTELYAQIGQDAVLRNHVVFESYGSNIEAWLRHIGWIFSLSDRETFHVAAVEGMASGAVPVFLPRAGVKEIFSDRWVFETPEAIADFIYETVTQEKWFEESKLVQTFAAQFDAAQVCDMWQEVLV